MYQRDGIQLDFWLADRGPLWFTLAVVLLLLVLIAVAVVMGGLVALLAALAIGLRE